MITMKKWITLCILFAMCICSLAQQERNSSVKILVLAKFSDVSAARQMEMEMVRQLKEKGYDAIISQGNISTADLNDETSFLSKIESLGVTGLIAFSDPSISNEYKNKPSVNAHVGITPVKVGIFRVNLGSNIPLAGGVKEKKTVRVTGAYYNKKDAGPVFSKDLKGDLGEGVLILAERFSKKMIKELSKKKNL